MPRAAPTGNRHNKRNEERPACVSCRSVAICQRPSDLWECKLCGEVFEKPMMAFQKKEKLKGIKAPISYRAQLARDILQNNSEAAKRIGNKQSFYGKTN